MNLRSIIAQGKPIIEWPPPCPDDYDQDDLIMAEAYQSEEWEYICDYLTEIMTTIQKKNGWSAKVENFGWQKLYGSKEFQAMSGNELLRQVLPETENTFNIWVKGTRRKGYTIEIQNFHHDNCAGDERYFISTHKE